MTRKPLNYYTRIDLGDNFYLEIIATPVDGQPAALTAVMTDIQHVHDLQLIPGTDFDVCTQNARDLKVELIKLEAAKYSNLPNAIDGMDGFKK